MLIIKEYRIKEWIKKVVPVAWLRLFREWVLQKNTGTIPEMNLKTRSRLQEVFREDILCVQEFTARDLSHWLSDSEAEAAQRQPTEARIGRFSIVLLFE